MQKPFRLLLAFGCLLLALVPAFGCQTHVPSILLEVEDPEGLGPTQLLVTVNIEGLETQRVTRPEAPNGPLASPQTLRIFMPDESVGQEVNLTVEALRDDKVVGTAQSMVVVRDNEDTAVKVRLVEVPYVCDETTCPLGCCSENACIEDAFGACGLGGGACNACSRIAADQCVDGACQCGEGTPCPAGFACEAGSCMSLGEGESCVTSATCTSPPGQCHEEQGTCGEDGKCAYAPKSSGASCDDGIRCTENDVCDGAGACGGTEKTCGSPLNTQCWDRDGACNEATGACEYDQKPAGTSCGTNTECSTSACNSAGACVATPVPDGTVCGGLDCGVCAGGTCNITCLAAFCCGDGTCRSPKGHCGIEP
ncbi:MAG TPA: hypothetical protein VK013_13840 [Myxococcaceae bacterium]|nr:hypothetical protein [Myxococcaceae bacterium]